MSPPQIRLSNCNHTKNMDMWVFVCMGDLDWLVKVLFFGWSGGRILSSAGMGCFGWRWELRSLHEGIFFWKFLEIVGMVENFWDWSRARWLEEMIWGEKAFFLGIFLVFLFLVKEEFAVSVQQSVVVISCFRSAGNFWGKSRVSAPKSAACVFMFEGLRISFSSQKG